MRNRSTSRLWFARPAGSCLILLTAICAACFAAEQQHISRGVRSQEATVVKAKILLSRLSMSAERPEAQQIQSLLDELLTLPLFNGVPPVLRSSEPPPEFHLRASYRHPVSPSLFQRPPPFLQPS